MGRQWMGMKLQHTTRQRMILLLLCVVSGYETDTEGGRMPSFFRAGLHAYQTTKTTTFFFLLSGSSQILRIQYEVQRIKHPATSLHQPAPTAVYCCSSSPSWHLWESQGHTERLSLAERLPTFVGGTRSFVCVCCIHCIFTSYICAFNH